MIEVEQKYWRQPETGFIWGPDIATPVMQCAWPYIVTPKKATGEAKDGSKYKDRHEITLMADPDSSDFKEFYDLVVAHKKYMLPLFNAGKQATINIEDDRIFKDGNSIKDVEEKQPYYVDKLLMQCRSNKDKKPLVYGIDPDEDGHVVVVDPSELKSGMFVKLVIRLLMTPSGISFQMSKIRIVKDTGERIGGGQRDTTSLLDVTEEDDVVEEAPVRKAAVAAPVKKATGRSAAVNLLS